MKVLFITPLIGIPKSEPPLGLMYMQAVLDTAGYESKIFDLYKSYDEVEKEIKEYDPDIVAIACFTTYRASSYKLARIAKEVKPKCKVVMGGPHATFMWGQIIKNIKEVDIIILGEAEYTMLELVYHLENRLPLSEVDGIVFRVGNGFYMSKPRKVIQNLDDLPFPNYRDIDLKKYAIPCPPTFPYSDIKPSICSSRGCYANCTFCSTRIFWGNWRARSPKNVVDEIEILYNKGARYFNFNDDIFTTDKNRVVEICKEMIKRNIKMKWYAETRVDVISPEMFKWMKDAGCYLVQFGVESGSDYMLKNINKMITTEQIKIAFKMAKDAGLQTEILLMVGNQGETWESIYETEKLLDEVNPDIVIISITHIFPATKLYEIAKEKGIINDNFWLKDIPTIEYTGDHSVKTLMKMRLHIIKHYYRNKGRFAFYRYVIGQIKKNPKILWESIKGMI